MHLDLKTSELASPDRLANESERPLFELFDDAVALYGDRPFLDFLGKKYSYHDAGELVAKLAVGFRHLGVKKGVKVGLFLPNCPYFVFCYFAVLKAGGTVVTYNPLLAEREILRQIDDSETELIVTLDVTKLYSKIAAIRRDTKIKKLVVCTMTAILPFPKSFLFPLLKRKERVSIPHDNFHVPFGSLLHVSGSLEPPEIDPREDTAALLYTGGTTGVPKGVCLSHSNIFANTIQSALQLSIAERGKERVLAVIPFSHSFGMTVVMNTSIALGAEIILLPRFELSELLRTIDRKKPTLFAGVPTIFAAIVGSPKLETYGFSSLKFCNSGGDALPLGVKQSFESVTGCKLLEGYGLTEASPVATFIPLEGKDKPGSVGLPVAGTIIEIVSLDDHRTPLPPGERGEVCISGPQVMAGYWKNPPATANVLRDGRLRTGDVGYRDEDGYIYLVDRVKDIIKTGGYAVYPRIIEEVIELHPAIAEAAVVGVPDDYWGQRVTAFVVPAADRQVTTEELLAFLEDKISAVEIPKVIEFRTDLPKSPTGKVLKTELLA